MLMPRGVGQRQEEQSPSPDLSFAHAHEVISCQLLVCHGVVGIRVEHDEGKGQQVRGVSCGEGLWIVPEVPLCKLLHDTVYLLRFTCTKTDCELLM